VGESAPPESVKDIRVLVEADEAVERVPATLTMQLGPEEVLLNLAVEFRDGLSAEEIMGAIRRLQDAIRERHPEVRRIFIGFESHTPTRPSSGTGSADESAAAEEYPARRHVGEPHA
jgi:divalent metal cation (Fe/Co/Zn/Cd) transporter